MRRLLFLSIALIVYGSLYPWEFRKPVLSLFSVSLAALHKAGLDRYTIRDFCVNVALYMPVGLFGYFALERSSGLWRHTGPILLGCILSMAVETAQLFVVRRVTNPLDVMWNTAGSAMGVVVAVAVHELVDLTAVRRRAPKDVDRGAIALLLCGLAYLLFPLFPVMGRTALTRKLHVFAESSWFDLVAVASAAAAWFIVGRLLVSAKVPRPGTCLFVAAIGALPVQMFIVSRQPALAEVTGAAVGLLAFALFRHTQYPRAEACALWLLLLFRGFMPFLFTASRNTFTWIPFAGVLGFDWQKGLVIVLEKTFFYGAVIWTIRRTGTGLLKPTIITAATLAFIEAAQIHLYGRTPEITDIILALLIGASSRWLEDDHA